MVNDNESSFKTMSYPEQIYYLILIDIDLYFHP